MRADSFANQDDAMPIQKTKIHAKYVVQSPKSKTKRPSLGRDTLIKYNVCLFILQPVRWS